MSNKFLKITLTIVVSVLALPVSSTEFSFDGFWTMTIYERNGNKSVKQQTNIFIWPNEKSEYLGIMQVGAGNCIYHISQAEPATPSSSKFIVNTVQPLATGQDCSEEIKNSNSTFVLSSAFSGGSVKTEISSKNRKLVKKNRVIRKVWDIYESFEEIVEIASQFSVEEARIVASTAFKKQQNNETLNYNRTRIERKKKELEYRESNAISQAEKYKDLVNFPFFSHEIVHETETLTLYTDAKNRCGSHREMGGELQLNAVFNVTSDFAFDHSYLKAQLNPLLLNEVNASVCHEKIKSDGKNVGDVWIDVFVKDVFLTKKESITDKGYLVYTIEMVEDEPLISFNTLRIKYDANNSYTFMPNIHFGTYILGWLKFIDSPERNKFMESISSVNNFVKFSQFTAEKLIDGITPKMQFESDKANHKRLIADRLKGMGLNIDDGLVAAYLSGDRKYLDYLYTDGMEFGQSKLTLDKVKDDKHQVIRLYSLASNHHCGSNTFSPKSTRNVEKFSTNAPNYGERIGQIEIVLTISDYLRDYSTSVSNRWEHEGYFREEMDSIATEKTSWFVSEEKVSIIKDLNKVFNQTGCLSKALSTLEKNMVDGLL